MGERVSDSVSIAADRDAVLDVVLDLEAYPGWAEGIRAAEVLERDPQGRPVLCRFVVDARVTEVDYVLRYHHDGPHLTWELERSDMLRQLDGEYRLDEHDGVTDVTYTLEADITIPVPGFLKKRAAKVILDTSLRGLKQRVEAGG